VKKLCVFCGSAEGKNPSYISMAHELGKIMAKNQIGLVYGGATIGVMGALADSVLAHNGVVIGVIPKTLVDYEIAHKNLTELHVVESMHERKKLMYDRSDFFLTLPGGMGTLDEMFEILTWAQLKIHSKPCMIFNFNQFYDSLLAHLNRTVSEGFLKPAHLNLLQEVKSLDEIQNYLKSL
jgi:uncharacterized protein (TIGR00730 family)